VPPAGRSEEPSAAPTGEETAADGGQSLEPETPCILIAYFTWADNTVVEDPSAVDVDATTSASVLAPGNAAKIAGWIQQEVGGDLFSIVVSELYSSDYDECLERAADEKAEQARPALVDHVSGMEDYDIVACRGCGSVSYYQKKVGIVKLLEANPTSTEYFCKKCRSRSFILEDTSKS